MQFANNAFACFWFNNLKLNCIFSKASKKLWTISEEFSLPYFLPSGEIFFCIPFLTSAQCIATLVLKEGKPRIEFPQGYHPAV